MELTMKPKENKEIGVVTKYIGSKLMKDMETGQVVELEYVEKKVKHSLKRGWRRVYLEQFMEILTGLYAAGKKIDVVEFILENLNSENQLTLTQSQVIEKSGISRPTVVDTYKYLIEKNFMKKVGAVFVINPQFVTAFGSDKKNAMIAIKYLDEKEQELPLEYEEKDDENKSA